MGFFHFLLILRSMSEDSEVLDGGALGDCKENIETILGELTNSNQRLQEIAAYCQNSFDANGAEVYKQTQQYATDAVLNAAYHVHRGAEGLMEYFDEQMASLDKLSSSVESISVRYQGIQQAKKNTMEGDMPRNLYTSDKVTEEQVGESKRQNNRAVIDFTSLESVGVSF